MKKLTILMALALTASGLALSAPTPTSGPVFTNASTGTTPQGYLYVSFKETNLPPGQQVTYRLTANAVATWGCVAAGNKYKAITTTDVPELMSSEVSGAAGARGSIVGTATVDYPDKPAHFDCGPGTQARCIRIVYMDLYFADTTNNVVPTLTGNCAEGCRDLYPRGA